MIPLVIGVDSSRAADTGLCSIVPWHRSTTARWDISWLVRNGEPATSSRTTIGRQSKINLHSAAAPVAPHANSPTPGSADLCFVSPTPIAEIVAHLKSEGVIVELGPVPRTGALGPITSVYFRDPDGNLIEVSNYG